MEVIEYTFKTVATLPARVIRAYIKGLAVQMQASPDSVSSSTCPVKHVFAPGTYAREITMPAGLLVMGKLHRHSHINVISKGRVKVLTEFGVQDLAAPCTFTSEVGTQRVVLVLEETVWTTIHITQETDLAKIEEEIIAKDHSLLELTADYAVMEEV